MKTLLLIALTVLGLNAKAQTAEEAYLKTLLAKVTEAVQSNTAESERTNIFDAYCSILKDNANLPEISASVLGVNYHAKTGKLRRCRKACIWDSANASQKAQLMTGFHSSLVSKLDAFLTPALLNDPTSIVGSPQASSSRYSAELPISLPGGDLNVFFTITNLDRPDEKDASGKYMKNYFQNGPYKNFPRRIFLSDVKFEGLLLRNFYANDYQNRWNGMVGLTDSEKVNKIIEFMDTDTLQVDGKPYLCK